MFWIILGILAIVSTILFSKETSYTVLAFCVVLLISFIMFFTGVYVFLNLETKRQEVVSLQSEIETVRSAHYSDIESGSRVGGTLDNLQQSTALSNYLKLYAQHKAAFNAALVRYQRKKTDWRFYWFENAVFISDKVLEMELIN